MVIERSGGGEGAFFFFTSEGGLLEVRVIYWTEGAYLRIYGMHFGEFCPFFILFIRSANKFLEFDITRRFDANDVFILLF